VRAKKLSPPKYFLGEKNEMFVNAFVTFFLLGAVAFFGYLKAHNKEVRQTKRVLFLKKRILK
jgi:hypothetical protein